MRPVIYLWLLVFIVFADEGLGRAQGFALHTGNGKFFRTVQSSAQISALDGSFTIEFWFKADGPGVLINEVDAYDVSYWDYSLLELNASGHVLMGLPGISGAADIGSVELGSWNHVAIRYDAGSFAYDGFLNGVKSSNSLSGSRKMPSTGTPPNDSIRIAYMAFGRNASVLLGTGGFFQGTIDEVRIWSMVRSDDDIQGNQRVLDLPPSDALQSLWHLDEGTGINLGDASGKGNAGVDVGADWVASTLSITGKPLFGLISVATRPDGSADIVATVNPAGSATDVYLEYGATTAYGSVSPTNSIASQTADVKVTFSLSNLVHATYHYHLAATNPTGGTTSPDLSFTITNLSGFAATMDGTNYLRSSKITRPFFTNAAMTVEFWFNATGPGVMLNEVDSLNVSHWDYSLMEVLADGSLVAGLPNVPTVSAGKILFGKWYHVVLRYDPAVANLDLFLDGAKVGTSHGTRSLPWDYGSTVFIAMERGGPDNLGGGAFFKGEFDEVRIWRTAVSDADLAANASLILSGLQGDLFADWSFDSVSNEISPDKSPNADPAQWVNGSHLDFSDVILQLDLRPATTTGSVTDAIGTTVTLSGTVFSLDTNTVAYFVLIQGQVTNITPLITIQGATNTTVKSTNSGLEGGRFYSYYLVASNATAVVQGTAVTFLKIGPGGYSLSLSGAAYLRSANDQHTYFSDEMLTTEIWIKPTKAGVVMSETDRVSPSSLDTSLIEILTDGKVVAAFPGVPVLTLGTVVLGQWNNVVLRYNKATLTMDGFVNGVKSAGTSSGDRVAGWEVGRSVIYTFGKSTLTKLGTGESLPAEWDEIRLWGVARTDADILATYNKKLSGLEANLFAYYRFDDKLTSITDSSGHSNRGQIVGTGQFVVSGAPISINLKSVQIASDGTVTVQSLANPTSSVRIESTADFKTWTVGPTSTSDSLGIVTFNAGNISDSPIRFFRFKQL